MEDIKYFTKAEIEIIRFDEADIIATSGTYLNEDLFKTDIGVNSGFADGSEW